MGSGYGLLERHPTNPTTPYRGVGLSDGEALPYRAERSTAKSECAGRGNTPLPAIAGKPLSTPPLALQALMIAGRLLQNRAREGGKLRIKRMAGESYPDAVARAIAGLDPVDRDQLREQVRWVLDYEMAEG